MLGILGWKTRIISEMLVSCQSALSLEQGERLTDEGSATIASLQICISVELLDSRNFLLDVKVPGRLHLRPLGETILELGRQLKAFLRFPKVLLLGLKRCLLLTLIGWVRSGAAFDALLE